MKGVIQQPTSIVNSQAESPARDASVDTAAPEVPKDGQNVDGSQSISETSEKASTSSTITTSLASVGHNLDVDEAELALQPLRLTFETKNLELVEPALDCLHKPIAYDHLEGDPGLDGGKNSSLFTDILNMVCGCVDNSPLDNTILQVLKVLFTAVASTKFRVHGEQLLAVIRVCYNIALNSKSPINQATAKAMLTQMVSIIFRRTESDQMQKLEMFALERNIAIEEELVNFMLIMLSMYMVSLLKSWNIFCDFRLVYFGFSLNNTCMSEHIMLRTTLVIKLFDFNTNWRMSFEFKCYCQFKCIFFFKFYIQAQH